MRGQVVVFAIACARVASAEPLYPESYADRPLTLLDGMTELTVDLELRSSPGHTFSGRDPDVAIAHEFGPVELKADIGLYASGTVTVALPGLPLAINAGALSGVPQQNGSLHVAEFAGVLAKHALAPGAFAIEGGIGLTRSDNRVRTVTDELSWYHVYSTSLFASGELQLLPEFALLAGLGYQIPFGSTGEMFTSSLFGRATLVVTVGHSWDIYVLCEVDDLAGRPFPYLEAGFQKRWGG